MRLSPDFTLEELTRSETATRHSIKNDPDAEQLKNLKILATQILQPARNAICQPIVITSGFRCKKLNEMVGGKPNSYHLAGMAADIKTPSVKYAYDLAQALNRQLLTDIVLWEHSGNSEWIHVQWSRSPRHRVNLYYVP